MSEFAVISNEIDRKNTVQSRIVSRMREIDLCARVSKHMFDNDCSDGVKSFPEASLKLGGTEFYSNAHSRQLTDPILDSGIGMVRAMLQFVGFTVNTHGEFKRYSNTKPTDIIVESFGVAKLIRDSEAENYVFKGLTGSEIDAIRLTALNGNKGVAHLTIHETKSIPLDQLSEACFAMNKVLNNWLVKPILGCDASF